MSPANWRTTAELQAEISFLNSLRAAGGSVIEPVPRSDGSGYILEIEAPEGPRAAVLFIGVAGVEPNFAGNPDAKAIARRYGQVSAKLHELSDNLPAIAGRPSMDLEAILHVPSAIVSKQLSDESARGRLANLEERLSALLSAAPLSMGFAHGDLNSTNILFGPAGETVIDFDCCGMGFRANDVAAFARGVTLGNLSAADASTLIAEHLTGYSEVRPMLPVDVAALPAFLIVQRLWMASLHYDRLDRFGLYLFGPAYTDRLVSWLQSSERMLDSPPEWLATAS